MAHRSGKTGLNSDSFRKSTPGEPPKLTGELSAVAEAAL